MDNCCGPIIPELWGSSYDSPHIICFSNMNFKLLFEKIQKIKKNCFVNNYKAIYISDCSDLLDLEKTIDN